MLNHKSILITGGTGSLGKELTKTILGCWPEVRRLVIFFARRAETIPDGPAISGGAIPGDPLFHRDVRDPERLKRAFTGVDYVIHAAAMKHVHIAEYNPDECVKTNVGGAENVIKAALSSSVSKVVALSTDKACAPDQSIWRHQAYLGQAVHRGQQHPRYPGHQVLRGPLWQCHGIQRFGDSVFPEKA